MKIFAPYVAIIPSENNKGVVIIPGEILDSIIPYVFQLDDSYGSSQILSKIVSQEFYDFFIKEYTEDQYNFYSYLNKSGHDIESVYKKTEVEGISFTNSIDSPFPVFFLAMKKFLGLGKGITDWMPQNIKNEFGNLIVPYSQIEGVYILHNESHIEHLAEMFGENSIPFVILKDALDITINTSRDPVYLQLLPFGKTNSIHRLPKFIRKKYSALEFDDLKSYYIDCQESDSLPKLLEDLKEASYFPWDGKHISFRTYSKIANQFIISEKRYPLRNIAKRINFYGHWNQLLLTQYGSGAGHDFSDIDLYIENLIKDDSDFEIPQNHSPSEFKSLLSTGNSIHHLFFDDMDKFGCFAFQIFSSKYKQYFSSLLKKPQSDLGNALLLIGLSPEDFYINHNLTLSQLSQKLSASLISYYAWLVKQDKKMMKFLRKWGTETTKTKICSICGQPFILKHININPYCATEITDCCFQCPIVEFPSKEELPEKIMDFVNACGFFPTVDMTISDFNFMSRIKPEKRKEVLIAWAKMGKQDHIAHYFGTWFEGLVKLGLLPNNALVTDRGVMCVAIDNHICLSLAEMQIDNWLYSHNIPHVKEPLYPSHPIYNPSGLKKGDWKVGDIYIEYFGLTGDIDYDANSNSKILLSKELNIPLISIFPKDLKYLDSILSELLTMQ